MKPSQPSLDHLLEDTFSLLASVREKHTSSLRTQEVGTLCSVGQGIARVDGLPGVQSEELVTLGGDRLGLVFNLTPDEVGLILLDPPRDLAAGDEVERTHRVLDVPVGDSLLGRVTDALGRPLDRHGPFQSFERWPIERPAPSIMDRAAVATPLQTGIKVIDALIPIGRGQRELILGDRQTGKTQLAIDTIINQRGKGVLCIYCSIGQRRAAVARAIQDLLTYRAMAYTTVLVAGGEDPPGMQYVAPYAATAMAEYFMERGADVLVVYDDLTKHARAYRELSLLLRRPPGREAFPGDIFYLHSRLLERATHLSETRGGGSLTALPIIETEAQNLAAYIPTNLISITDGQIYLSPSLAHKGMLPAVDVGISVSRVGGKAQLKAYRSVATPLRLSYTQFEELETFARFGTRLDEATRRVLERGRRVREILKQDPYKPQSVSEQIASLLAVTNGLFDDLTPLEVHEAEKVIHHHEGDLDLLRKRIEADEELTPEELAACLQTIRKALDKESGQLHHANA
ncbi:MAG: alternate F1F0 ATPase, F1 subunit alpha [Trueperaceae bacterium]|nr:MAG: alternate F1F0 ATPase, F1 subunit alpha [Trueperaceae bacterium]